MKIGSATFVAEIKKFDSGSRYVIIPSNWFKTGVIQKEKVFVTVQDIKEGEKHEPKMF